MAYGLINDIFKKLAEMYTNLGAYYSASWKANSTSAANTALTNTMTLGKAGTYIVTVTFPTTNAAIGVKINGISGTGYMWFHNGGDDTKSLILVTALDDVQLYVRTYNSTAVTFTNTSRGGISAIRIK